MQWANTLFGQGLLDPEIEKRLTAQQKQRMGRGALMDAGLAMLAGSGWQSQPTTLGQGLAQGMQAGRYGYAQQAQMIAQQQQQQQERAAAEARARAEAEYMASLPPGMRKMAQVLGVGAFAKSRADQENKLAIERERAKSKDSRTTLQKNLEAQGLTPGTPAYQQAMRTQLAKSTGTTVNVGAGPSPFDKALASKDAESFVGYRDAAMTAGGMLDQLDVLDRINAFQQGGKIGEAKAFIGQYFGADSAANMQTFNAVQSDMVRRQAESLKGAMSDRDIALLEATMPQFGNDPRANKIIIDILRNAAQRTIQNYEAADAHLAKDRSRGLSGFRPVVRNTARMPEVNAGNVSLDDMSEADIAAEIERRKRGGRP